MNLYVAMAVIAYLMFAINAVIDKFLLHKSIPEPATYAFYIGLLSNLAIFLAPWGFTLPGAGIIAIALLSGGAFLAALVLFFHALKRQDASVVLPTIGGIVPIISLVIGYLIVGERLNGQQYLALTLLVAGTFLIGESGQRTGRWLVFSALSALLFAVSFDLAKVVYNSEPFISGLIWTRFGLLLGALVIFLFPTARARILHTTAKVERPSGALFLVGQGLAAGAGAMQNFAVSLGQVTLVNALQGTQFAFLFILTWVLSARFPAVLKENFSRRAVTRKLAATASIMAGLALIV